MSRALLATALSLILTTPVFAQHEGHGAPPQTPPPGNQPAAAHHHGDQTVRPPAATTVLPADAPRIAPPESGNDIPPDPPADHAADAFFPKADMDRARAILDKEHGDVLVSKIMLNEFELTRDGGQDGYRWNAQAWFGGDIDRLVLKSEGEGAETLELAEVQALYSRAVGPYTDVQVGVRHDLEPDPDRTYLAIGFESLLPYWFEAEGALFVGERGQALGRLEGSYDLLITQRLALQPSVEVNFVAKDDSATGTGSGLSTAELGLRLRYEFQREFAPYVGIVWERRFGDTADYARADGEDVETTLFVAGLRAWF